MHKERVGSLRFEKGKSETMKTLEGLKERGVKVDLGIPDEVRIANVYGPWAKVISRWLATVSLIYF